ncbi:MAG TPA: gamma-glutamyltransferase [Acetobacteraceae bacterium]|nr:gamma-glutamyltransferase [Acetobacteraceae bacterium]
MNRIRIRALIVAGLLLFASPCLAYDPAPVAARNYMVVATQALASRIGAEILEQGGNAIDAAVAVGYALAVVYPAAGNLGGGGFMLLRLADGRTTFLDFREKAPQAATEGMFLDAQGNVAKGRSTKTWLGVGVPGSAAGLEAARARYGTLSREAVLAPAIRLAREGFVLGPGDVALLRQATEDFRRDPASAAIFLPSGHPLEVGDRLVQPDLARTLERLAAEGPEAIYGGPVGAAIVAASEAGGGILQQRDFQEYRVRELAPIACDYRGYLIQSAPPPSSGGVVICEILNILEGYDLRAMGFRSAAEVHVLVEAMRHAFLDRNSRLGDPDFVQNPVERLLDKTYAAAIRARIDPLLPTPSAALHPGTPPHEGSDTVHYSVMDRAGNAVAVTTSLNDWFGMRAVAPGTGILLNDTMDDFAAKPGVPNMFGLVQGEANAVAPGKTPLSSMSPTIVSRDGKPVLVVGAPGGSRIITVVLEAILNLVDHGMTVQEAIDAPRIHHQWLPDTVFIERFALSPDTRALLEARGYRFTESRACCSAEAILAGAPRLTPPGFGAARWLDSGIPELPGAILFGAHDPRGPAGAAVGQ